MRQFEIEIGGSVRPIKLTAEDGFRLQKRFGFASPAAWLIEDVLGINAAAVSNTSANLEAQAAIVARALMGGAAAPGKKVRPISDEQVLEWFQNVYDAGGSIRPVLWTVVVACYAAGWVLARPYDLEVEAPDMRRVFFAETAADLRKILLESPDAAAPPDPTCPPTSSSTVRASDSP